MFETETVKRPEVSLVITNFNGRKFLPKIIKMLEAQTYQDFEVVFVDDGSRDDSVNFMENVSFDKIVLKKQENKGVASAKRVGVLASRGKYVMFADVDDEFEPKFIETYVEAIKISRADVEGAVRRVPARHLGWRDPVGGPAPARAIDPRHGRRGHHHHPPGTDAGAAAVRGREYLHGPRAHPAGRAHALRGHVPARRRAAA